MLVNYYIKYIYVYILWSIYICCNVLIDILYDSMNGHVLSAYSCNDILNAVDEYR
jgi:hypothetical protein